MEKHQDGKTPLYTLFMFGAQSEKISGWERTQRLQWKKFCFPYTLVGIFF